MRWRLKTNCSLVFPLHDNPKYPSIGLVIAGNGSQCAKMVKLTKQIALLDEPNGSVSSSCVCKFGMNDSLFLNDDNLVIVPGCTGLET